MSTIICALDWGIGHASRSLALAERLRAGGESVDFAAAGLARTMLLREAGAGVTVHELPPYRVDYRSSNMTLGVLRQLPKIGSTVWREHRALDEILRRHAYDRIISDSRFGCFSRRVRSVFLTHQLHPIFGVPLAGNLYRRYLEWAFDEFWVPDAEGPDRLSGQLSDPRGYDPVRYLGPLSRLERSSPESDILYDYFALLSGPEPQRSRLEKILVQSLSHLPGRHLIVGGRPGVADEQRGYRSGEVRLERRNFVAATELSLLLRQSKKIICRSGYSTLMDLDQLGIREALLVPTPGQTEQEYLARRWVEQRGGGWVTQENVQFMLTNSAMS